MVSFLLLVGGVYGLRQSALRIAQVQFSGLPATPAGQASGETGEDTSLTELVVRALQGNYFGIIPRDSVFFFPAERIRSDIIAARPDIAAVSISLNGLTGISIQVNSRVPVAHWCGVTRPNATASTSSSGRCYVFDAGGFVYATTSAEKPVNAFTVYASQSRDGSHDSASAPIGSTLSNADKLPAAFGFARELSAFGSPVSSIVFRADEVDAYLESGTRITYVLGDEHNAFTALVSSREHLNVADGSVEYVDLRFGKETYVKRKR